MNAKPKPKIHVGAAMGSAGISVGAGAVAAALGGIEQAGHQHTSIWSNVWVLGAVIICGIGLLIAVVVVANDWIRFLIGQFRRTHDELTTPESHPAPTQVLDETAEQARSAD